MEKRVCRKIKKILALINEKEYLKDSRYGRKKLFCIRWFFLFDKKKLLKTAPEGMLFLRLALMNKMENFVEKLVEKCMSL